MLTWEQAVDVEFCLVVKLNVLAEFFGVNFYDGLEHRGIPHKNLI